MAVMGDSKKQNRAAGKAADAYKRTMANPKDPEKAPGFLKTGGPKTDDNKIRRTAKFLILIGSERASEILSRLPPDQVEAISREITSVKGILPDEGEAILEEFRFLLSSPYGFSGGAAGGLEAARRILYAAFGPEKGEALLLKAAPETRSNPLDFLEDFSGAELALLFKEEPAQAAAMVFSRLSPKLAAEAIAGFTGEKKLDIVRRIAKQAPVPPEVLDQVAGALREKARHIGGAGTDSFDGMGALAAILKSADASFGDHILSELEREDPDLGKTLKDKIYTLEDLVYAADLPIQKKLAEMHDRDIVLLLKGRSDMFKKKIFNNLSQGRRDAVLEEEEISGAVPKREADEAAGNFLAWFRCSREEGKILMVNEEDTVI